MPTCAHNPQPNQSSLSVLCTNHSVPSFSNRISDRGGERTGKGRPITGARGERNMAIQLGTVNQKVLNRDGAASNGHASMLIYHFFHGHHYHFYCFHSVSFSFYVCGRASHSPLWRCLIYEHRQMVGWSEWWCRVTSSRYVIQELSSLFMVMGLCSGPSPPRYLVTLCFYNFLCTGVSALQSMRQLQLL